MPLEDRMNFYVFFVNFPVNSGVTHDLPIREFCVRPGRVQTARFRPPCPLEPQVLSLLSYLLNNRDRIVSEDELIDEIWQGRVVSDAAINTRIRAVRWALRDDHVHQRFLRTYPKRGFQFVAETDMLEGDG
ncbi:DNA-binding winged helix-turn-helix (wHTH) protein [Halomonas fontilapidosi]|uniref:DNA-binding winged helix-turn-helix (WHTH) protein n=1 Tax=Halomonas fontilapidosi TaxID=616675 RepID=A0A7W5DMX7_9GAMM|nr:winged helix-turn-helix domain-containing protein [Halomonas fontilapidosi]MBB3185550.1 DNA-binding winged helix-turn-helix (wHTH) protein [Halomonas fontilapidosi]